MTGLMMMNRSKMTKKERVIAFENYLEELYQDARCELNYSKDYELLIAVVLSAQTTDKRVNSVTPILFSKYPTLKELANRYISKKGTVCSWDCPAFGFRARGESS